MRRYSEECALSKESLLPRRRPRLRGRFQGVKPLSGRGYQELKEAGASSAIDFTEWPGFTGEQMHSEAPLRGLAGLSIRRDRLAWMSLSLCLLALIGAAAARPAGASTFPADSAGLLPAGYLSARGSQIVGPDGTPIRIASVGLTGMNVVGGRLQLAGPFKGVEGHVAAMRAMGFNCVRVDWIDRTLDDPRAMAQLDAFVSACKHVGLKVIFDNHNNEATRADWENAAQQKNGLWFDTGPGTDGTDGAGNQGTISAAKFQEDWVMFARHWAGNSTVIGFDIRNEPCAHTKTPALWGGKGPTDIHAMYETVGNGILAVNPDALIICEAVIMVGLGLPDGAEPEWLRRRGRPDAPRTGALY